MAAGQNSAADTRRAIAVVAGAALLLAGVAKALDRWMPSAVPETFASSIPNRAPDAESAAAPASPTKS